MSACRIGEKEKIRYEKNKIYVLFESEEDRVSLGMITLALILPDTVTLQAPATMYSCASEKSPLYMPNYDWRNECVCGVAKQTSDYLRIVDSL